MKLWEAHAVFEIMGAITAVPLPAPAGWIRVDDNFTPFLDGEDDSDGILAAAAEFRRGVDGDLITYSVEVMPGPKDNEVTAMLLGMNMVDVLLERTVEVPSPYEVDFSVAAHSLTRLGLPIADAFAEKITDLLTSMARDDNEGGGRGESGA